MGTGSFPMELEFPAVVTGGISTETEMKWWYVWTADKVERMESTAVRYLIQWMLYRPYTLECTQQAGVSDIVSTLLLFNFTAVLTCVAEEWESHCPTPYYSKPAWLLLSSVLYRGSSTVCLKKVLRDQTVIMKLCAVKHWFDYNQCRWQPGEATEAVCPRLLL